MQKSDEKLNANAVGANCIRPHFEGMTLKKEKGITLIALIITVIVMLILVGVTINVALNGGLFEKTQQAVVQTNIEKDKEILQNIALGFLGTNGEINFAEFETYYEGKTVEGYTIKDEGEYASATKGETIFYINKYGGISEEKPTEKEYTFTLNELKEGGYTYLDNDYTGITFDEDYLWDSVIKEDLSSNEKYLANLLIESEDILFMLESTDSVFTNYLEITFDISPGNTGDYCVYGEITTSGEFDFVVGVYNPASDFGMDNLIVDSNPADGQMTVEEFLNEYGDVEFKFVDVSSIELPSEE